jgi:hypothetical protein
MPSLPPRPPQIWLKHRLRTAITLVEEQAYAYDDPSHRSAVPRGCPITDAELEHNLEQELASALMQR